MLLAGAIVGALPLSAQALGEDTATTAFVVRDGAGLMGLVALGAAFSGGRSAWTLPFAWPGRSGTISGERTYNFRSSLRVEGGECVGSALDRFNGDGKPP